MKQSIRFIVQHPVRLSLFVGWAVLFSIQTAPINLLTDFGLYGLLGIVGAIFANATGAGGGVVFVPFFNHLQFSTQSVVATSFAIQCCGMTAGAITWWRYKVKHHQDDKHWAAFPSVLMLSVPASLCGVWFAQYGPQHIDILMPYKEGFTQLHIAFGMFSVLLSIAIFATIPLFKRTEFKPDVTQLDVGILPFISFFGGIITAWLSIGVGELVAVYLIIRGFNVTMSIAVAVILSAFTVWGAVVFHLVITQAVVWDVVLFAGAGAIIGGTLAKYLVLVFSPPALKCFFGVWVLLLGISGLPIF